MVVMHERPGVERLDTEAGEFRRSMEAPAPPGSPLVVPPAPPGSPVTPKRWPTLVATIVLGAVIVAGGVWWLLDSTASQSDYDDLAAELDATRVQLSDADAAFAEVQADLTDAQSAMSTRDAELASALAASARLQGDFEALESEHASLTEDLVAARAEATGLSAQLGDVQESVEGARDVVEAVVLMELNFDSVLLDEMTQAGVDVTRFNDLLARLGRDETIEEWAASWGDFDGAWSQVDRAVRATDDEALIDLWRTWNWADPGSDDERTAMTELYVRAYELMLERLAPVG